MIRRSTLVFLTCLAAVGTPTLRAKSVVAAVEPQQSSAQMLLAEFSPISQPVPSQPAPSQPLLIAQASGGALSSELNINARGEAVRALQLRLQQSGFYKGSVDGLYGLDTQRAVSAFQASVGLKETGSLDDETWQKLQSLGNENGGEAVSTAGGAPETAPTASELPATSEDGENDTAASGETESGSGGLGKMFGISLGLAAVLASFGIGFFLANRPKADDSDEGEWGEMESAPNGSGQSLPSQSRTFQFAPSAKVEPLPPVGSQQNGQSAASGSGPMRQNGVISPMNHSLRTSGQMGGTSPLAPVDIIEGLIGDLRNPDPTRRRKAIWELGQRGSSLAMQPLVDSMVDADSKEKSLVLAALSEIGIRSLKPMSKALAIALQDDNPEVRKNAIRDLTRVYDLVVQISQMLGQATEDEDPEVRQTANWALDQLSRIRRTQDLDANVRSFATGNTAAPIDLLSSEASLRRSQQGL
jgi:hypothetical protein